MYLELHSGVKLLQQSLHFHRETKAHWTDGHMDKCAHGYFLCLQFDFFAHFVHKKMYTRTFIYIYIYIQITHVLFL